MDPDPDFKDRIRIFGWYGSELRGKTFDPDQDPEKSPDPNTVKNY